VRCLEAVTMPMGFLLRLLFTVLLLPLLIIGLSPSFLWEGYEGPRAETAKRREKAAKQQADIERRNWELAKLREESARAKDVAEWMAAHPVDPARIEREQRRRLVIQETERRAKLAAEEEKRHEARMAIETALAIPLPEKKAKLLSEMQLPPRLADLQRFARPDDHEEDETSSAYGTAPSVVATIPLR